MVWDTSITLDASMWNGAVGELSSYVINNIPLDHVLYNIQNTFGTNLPIDFLSLFFVCFMYLYSILF